MGKFIVFQKHTDIHILLQVPPLNVFDEVLSLQVNFRHEFDAEETLLTHVVLHVFGHLFDRLEDDVQTVTFDLSLERVHAFEFLRILLYQIQSFRLILQTCNDHYETVSVLGLYVFVRCF